MTRLGIAAESRSDASILTDLADRLLMEHRDWADDELPVGRRRWSGLTPNEEWFDFHQAVKLARGAGLPLRGDFSGEPGKLDALMHRALLLLFATQSDPPLAVVVGRDTDGHRGREKGFQQAVEDRTWPFKVIGALASPEIEAWLVVAWGPDDKADRKALAAVSRRLGFDPTTSPEKLTSGKSTDPKDAKRALRELCANGRTAEARWATFDVDATSAAGRNCGLTSYVEDVRAHLVPLFTPASKT